MNVLPSPEGPWWAEEFSICVLVGTRDLQLDRAAVLLSAHRSRHVAQSGDVGRELARFDAIAEPIPHGDLDAWRRRLFVQLSFTGNGQDYHDVRNSFLPDVVERRLGIPISLAVLGMEVGRRCGLELEGIGMPGHFLVRHRDSGVYIDAFHGGQLLDIEGCAQAFHRLYPDRSFDPEYLRNVDAHSILVRMLANLKANYARTRDLQGLLAVMRMRLMLPMPTLDEGRELVRLLDATGSWSEASNALDQLEAGWSSAGEVLAHERDRLNARLN